MYYNTERFFSRDFHWTVLPCILITYTAFSSIYEHSPYGASSLRHITRNVWFKTDSNITVMSDVSF